MRRETIQVIQKPETDRNGDIVDPLPDGVALPGCVIWPRAAEERDGGEFSIDGENVATPDNETARGLGYEDYVLIRDEVHMIDEPPSRYIGRRILLKTKRVRT